MHGCTFLRAAGKTPAFLIVSGDVVAAERVRLERELTYSDVASRAVRFRARYTLTGPMYSEIGFGGSAAPFVAPARQAVSRVRGVKLPNLSYTSHLSDEI